MASLEDLIPTVNKLQDVMYASGIDTLDLPVLAVVGSQSSGKSSILETLVGRDFLPRGTGIVTRRPLVLQLNNIKIKVNEDTNDDEPYHNEEEWGEFLHLPGKKFHDFDEIRHEIEHETARIAGKNKGISKLPINLKIFSPHVLNLTLVDLPGITKVPIGEQPIDIEKQIKNLILDYIATPNCLILAVSPANVDLVNSESLKLAKEVDPYGKRTIGVITKLDLMDSGTNAMDILLGKVYPLELGFVGIVNRSQQDIQLNISVKQALENEDHYFARHPVYRTIANRCGTRYLAKLLNKTLMAHIRDKLPDIKTKLNMLINQTEKDLLSFGSMGLIDKKESKAGLILQLMNKFATNFISSIDGNSSNINTKELCGGARIYYIYNDIYGKTLKTIDPTTNLTTDDIRTAIRNSTGPRATLFVPELAFDLLIKPQIKLLLEPSQRCVELVFDELMKICQSSSTNELARYPNLKGTLIDVISDLLRERLTPTHSYVESLIDIQTAYINTNHPRFLSATEVMADIMHIRDRRTIPYSNHSQQQQQMFNYDADETISNINPATTSNETDDIDESSVASPQESNSGKNPTSLAETIINGTNSVNMQDNKNKIPGMSHSEIFSNSSTGKPSGTSGIYANSTTSLNSQTDGKDSFLNYFFGKEKGSLNQQTGQPHQQQQQQPTGQRMMNGMNRAHDINTAMFSGLRLSDNNYPDSGVTFGSDNTNSDGLTEREQLECELIRRLIISYFNIVREMIEDQVPKAIMCLLVNFSKENVQNRLVTELYKESMIDNLLQEDETLVQERINCEKLLETYKKANSLVHNIL
ncbi:similar to Saccharomyces cerevisiae YLL001W DNM1 Dynamin-related GTPase required for mitochondrial fission and morphology [Maudiozyma saulgeensis]|uniref:Similar to Saccharomyces cerevisiae YLL001W DNM1 Dynamin-related GTPase required for mitochondrial fission and morphology n=1 Tax=Maudiozyma saulgeensis TaxID=1789683 RepID=A0A1X7R4Q3_9SACH|nr:similar to Saccharomyces cerevisiae YLL001W DNM1 Dynamin-related GTPase required for mitochondrial fission and morphology [Kazachstania saulgeensis]